MKPNRRELLGGLLAGAAASGCTGGDWTARPGRVPDPDSDPTVEAADVSVFPVGAMAGDPLPDGLLVVTRYLGTAAVELQYRLWDGTTWGELAAEPVSLEEGGFVHHELSGLPADTPVAFQFVDADGAASASAIARTALAPGTGGTLRLLVTACSKFREDGGMPVIPNALSRGTVDLILWAGDTLYTYDQTLEEYRARWTTQLQLPEFVQALAAGAHMFNWDDPEVTNNWSGDDVDPQQLDNGVRAFFEFTPTRTSPDHPRRMWRSLRMGDVVEVFELDCRGERDLETLQYLSDDQWSWFEAALAASPCRWKLIVNSVPIAQMPPLFDAADEVVLDRWAGFPDERDRMLALVDSVPGAFFVSGDIHMPCVARVEAEGTLRNTWELIAGAAQHRTNPVGNLMLQQPDLYADQYPWAESVRTATLVDLDDMGFMRVRYIGEEDVVYFDGLWDDHGRLLQHTITPVPR